MEDITNHMLGKRRTTDLQVQECEKRPRIVAFTLAEFEKAGKEKYPDLMFSICTKVDGAGALTCCRKDLQANMTTKFFFLARRRERLALLMSTCYCVTRFP